MVDFKLKVDEIKSIAAGLLKVQDESSNVEVVEGTLLKFTVTIKALVKEISDEDLKSMMQNRQALDEMTRKYNELQAQYDAVNQQMEKLKSDYDEAYNNRGNAYAALERFAEAERDLQTAVKLKDNSAAIHNNLGSVYLSQKKFDAALKEYTRALQLNPTYGEALYNRAVVYYAQGNFSAAMTDVDAALKLNPNDSATRELRDRIKSKVG